MYIRQIQCFMEERTLTDAAVMGKEPQELDTTRLQNAFTRENNILADNKYLQEQFSI